MSERDVYIIDTTKPDMTCKSCGRDEDLRFGHCFDCAEAESIIAEGIDMYEKDINGVEVEDGAGIKVAMEKVAFLIKKGWRPPEALPNEQGDPSGETDDATPPTNNGTRGATNE